MRHNELCAIFTLFSLLGCGGGDDFQSGTGGTAAGGSAGASSGGSGGTQVPLDEQIDPIAVGRKWTYDVEVYGTYPYCKAGSYSGQVLGEKELSGKHSYQVQSLCPAAGVSSYAVDGDRVWVYYTGDWLLALDAPVEEGHSWSNGTASFNWESQGSVTVAAGTFDDCWSAHENVSWEAFTIFCRGVGPIHWHLKNADGNGFDAQLTEKNF